MKSVLILSLLSKLYPLQLRDFFGDSTGASVGLMLRFNETVTPSLTGHSR